MQYAVFLYVDAAVDVSPEGPEWQASMSHHMAFADTLQQRGIEFSGAPLTGDAAATTLRSRDGSRVVTDGPFAETKEQLWGYYVLDAADLDTVLEVCGLLWEADHGSIEVRPVIEVPAPA